MLKILLLLVTAMITVGCYEKHITAQYVNPVQVWLVNNTENTIDSLDIGRDSTVLYNTVPIGASVKVILPITQELIITEPDMCKRMIPSDSYTLTPNEQDRLTTNCRSMFTFSKDDLYKASSPLLAKEYVTCLLLYSDGTLEARTEHSTPWPSSYGKTRAWPDKQGKTRSPCSNPKAEQAVRFEPR